MAHQIIESAPFNTADNSKIPFDILYGIFSFYAEDETPDSPLETLLLVCRFWKEAALEHRVMWSKFNIEIQGSQDARRWRQRIDRRLGHSGPDSPIIIRLRRDPKYSYGSVDIHRILRSLTGPLGFTCARWKEMELDVQGLIIELGHDYFEHPTPILTSLKLNGMTLSYRTTFPFFPWAPMLQTFVVSNCGSMVFPDITNVEFIGLHHFIERKLSGCITDLSTLTKATRLRHLTLDIYAHAILQNLSNIPPSLISLYLGAGELPVGIVEVNLPALRHLSLEFYPPNASILLKCRGIPLHQLETLEVVLDTLDPTIDEDDLEDYQRACTGFLGHCPNVNQLLCNRYSMPMLCSVFKGDSTGQFILFPNGISIRMEDTKRTIQLPTDKLEREILMSDLYTEMVQLVGAEAM